MFPKIINNNYLFKNETSPNKAKPIAPICKNTQYSISSGLLNRTIFC